MEASEWEKVNLRVSQDEGLTFAILRGDQVGYCEEIFRDRQSLIENHDSETQSGPTKTMLLDFEVGKFLSIR